MGPAAPTPTFGLPDHAPEPHGVLRDVPQDTAEYPGDLPGSFLGRQVWRINCGDVADRDRCLTVLVEQNRVVLVGPPGETAVLNSGQLGELRTALREAAEQAER